MNSEEAILKEIQEITAQWQAEVPGGRKTWPRSIRERVVELYRLGMSAKAVADATGIAYYTVLNWKRRDPEFKRLKMLPSMSQSATVTVTTPKGLTIKGLSFDQLLIALERLR